MTFAMASTNFYVFVFYCVIFRLKEIDMSEYDAATYNRFSEAVRRQVQSLRIILDSLQVNTPHYLSFQGFG